MAEFWTIPFKSIECLSSFIYFCSIECFCWDPIINFTRLGKKDEYFAKIVMVLCLTLVHRPVQVFTLIEYLHVTFFIDHSLVNMSSRSPLQELKNLRPQLYSAAEYCEKSYLHKPQWAETDVRIHVPLDMFFLDVHVAWSGSSFKLVLKHIFLSMSVLF